MEQQAGSLVPVTLESNTNVDFMALLDVQADGSELVTTHFSSGFCVDSIF